MIDQNILQDTVFKKIPALFHFLSDCFKRNCFLLLFDDFFVPISQIFWHMGTGQRAVPLEPAL